MLLHDLNYNMVLDLPKELVDDLGEARTVRPHQIYFYVRSPACPVITFPAGEVVPQAHQFRPITPPSRTAFILDNRFVFDSAAATADPNGRLGGKPQNLRVEPTTGV